jgi:hypothetical protein
LPRLAAPIIQDGCVITVGDPAVLMVQTGVGLMYIVDLMPVSATDCQNLLVTVAVGISNSQLCLELYIAHAIAFFLFIILNVD